MRTLSVLLVLGLFAACSDTGVVQPVDDNGSIDSVGDTVAPIDAALPDTAEPDIAEPDSVANPETPSFFT